MKYHTAEVMPPPSPNSMLSSELCVWRPSKKTAISVDDVRHFWSRKLHKGGCYGPPPQCNIQGAQLPKSRPCHLQVLRLPRCFLLPHFTGVICMGLPMQRTCNTHATHMQHTYNTHATRLNCVFGGLQKKQPFLLMMFGTSDHNIEVGGCGGKQGNSVVSCGWPFFLKNPVSIGFWSPLIQFNIITIIIFIY